MKKAVFALALVTIGAVGCGKSKTTSIPSRDTVADISAPPAPVTPVYQPTPVAQPVVYDSSPASMTTSTGGSYTIKRGDTLYSIARQRYGDGKQWQKIAGANPGVRPESLRVGQTIVVP